MPGPFTHGPIPINTNPDQTRTWLRDLARAASGEPVFGGKPIPGRGGVNRFAGAPPGATEGLVTVLPSGQEDDVEIGRAHV